MVIKPRGLREAMGAQATADGVAANRAFLQSRVFVAYPWLQEAQVAGVSDGTVHVTSQARRTRGCMRVVPRVLLSARLLVVSLCSHACLCYQLDLSPHARPPPHPYPSHSPQGVRRVLDRSEAVEWQEEADDLMAQSLTKRGILLGECPVLLHVRPVEGLVRNFDGTGER